jgi:hypothetical protein
MNGPGLMSEDEFKAMILAKATKRHIVMATQGQGGIPVRSYARLGWALRYIERHRGEASFGVILPTGEWHTWK